MFEMFQEIGNQSLVVAEPSGNDAEVVVAAEAEAVDKSESVVVDDKDKSSTVAESSSSGEVENSVSEETATTQGSVTSEKENSIDSSVDQNEAKDVTVNFLPPKTDGSEVEATDVSSVNINSSIALDASTNLPENVNGQDDNFATFETSSENTTPIPIDDPQQMPSDSNVNEKVDESLPSTDHQPENDTDSGIEVKNVANESIPITDDTPESQSSETNKDTDVEPSSDSTINVNNEEELPESEASRTNLERDTEQLSEKQSNVNSELKSSESLTEISSETDKNDESTNPTLEAAPTPSSTLDESFGDFETVSKEDCQNNFGDFEDGSNQTENDFASFESAENPQSSDVPPEMPAQDENGTFGDFENAFPGNGQ